LKREREREIERERKGEREREKEREREREREIILGYEMFGGIVSFIGPPSHGGRNCALWGYSNLFLFP
jgi:hypothetical protein